MMRRPAARVYRSVMVARVQRADLVAAMLLAVVVGGAGTGIGIAAAHVREGSSSKSGPLRILPRGATNDIPSIQRDRVRLRHMP
jgi:hypothetical protein